MLSCFQYQCNSNIFKARNSKFQIPVYSSLFQHMNAQYSFTCQSYLWARAILSLSFSYLSCSMRDELGVPGWPGPGLESTCSARTWSTCGHSHTLTTANSKHTGSSIWENQYNTTIKVIADDSDSVDSIPDVKPLLNITSNFIYIYIFNQISVKFIL